MADGPLKVALLARAGSAREQLRRALSELGAELVLEADPAETDPSALRASGARAVLVSMEPATEAALDRFEELLLDPAFTVLYDEAETTSRLSGWDLNRWARHLAAKLLGRDSLPPAPVNADPLLAPQPEPPPERISLLELAPLDAPGLADETPMTASGHGSMRPSIDHLELSPIDMPLSASGAIAPLLLLLGGQGALDALRRILSVLPVDFPVALRILLELEGDRHGQLVAQLAPICRLPVQLVDPGQAAVAGEIGVLISDPGRLPELGPVLAKARANGGACVVLSGTDPASVELLLSGHDQGLRLFAQDPASCVDARAVQSLQQAGVVTATAAELASRLLACYPPQSEALRP